MRKLLVIINQASGSVPADAEQKIADELSSLDSAFDIHCLCGEDLNSVWGEIDAQSYDGVIAWGGDGTISFILERAMAVDLPVLPLPGGTMNLLPKQIHGRDCDWQSCLRDALTNPQSRDLSGIRVGSVTCYVGVLIGRLTRLARSREHLRTGEIASAVGALVNDDVLDLSTRLRVNDEAACWDATALGVFVPDDGREGMDVASIDPDNLGELVEMGLETLMGDWKGAAGVDHRTARLLDISLTDGAKVSVTLDGEPDELEASFTVEFVPRAARVWSAGTA